MNIIFLFSYCAAELKDSRPPSTAVKEQASTDTNKPEAPVSPAGKLDGKKETEKKKEPVKDSKTVTESEEQHDNDSSDVSERPKSENSSSGLKAGYADDNKQFNYFAGFLEKFKSVPHIDLNISERIFIKIKEKNGKPASGARVRILSGGSEIESGTAFADGTFLFFPSEHSAKLRDYKAVVSKNGAEKEISFKRDGQRNIETVLNVSPNQTSYPMDIAFIMDTTGSMGEEINRLKSTIELINLNLSGMKGAKLRFGMVLYRDKGEEYVTKVIPFTSDLDVFRKELDRVSADGGGDYPEDLQSALDEAVNKLNWNRDALKLSFIITDAPPHIDYGQKFNYMEAAKKSKRMGMKIFSIGTGGLDVQGEYTLRQISQYTYAKYIFLTYGEKGESEGGAPGSVSHHTGANFATDKLESIVIRFAKEEYFHANGKPLEEGESYFSANKIKEEKREDTLLKLFDKGVSQLSDFSSLKLEQSSTLGILPAQTEDKSILKNAEYFSEQLLISVKKNSQFKIVERKDLQKVLKEWKLAQDLGNEEESAARYGKMLGAKLLLISRVYKKTNNYEMYMKLLNSETGEVLSVTKLLIAKELGL
ncbi:MAG TPA: VWA domain-containing protein [Leptospiraceae bacterium]|nr:VWA domain-containing protein [Leptospiraceae bacterium]